MANAMDRILGDASEIEPKIMAEDIPWFEKFTLAGYIVPNKANERIDIETLDYNLFNTRGVVYLIVVDGILFKIGQTSNTMAERVKSYNCGKMAYRDSGTCSTSNFFLLQNMLSIGETAECAIYLWEAPNTEYSTMLGGTQYGYADAAKATEKELILDVKDTYGEMPYGNVQS